MAISAAQLNVRINTEGASAAKRDIDSVGDSVDRSATQSRMLGGAFLGMGSAIAGGFGYGVTQAISFGEQMANVNSIAQLSTAELAALSDEVLALGSASGQSPQVLAAGLYDIASSGFAGADGMKVLEASSRAATAGMTTTDVAARGVTAALNAYNLGADDAAHVSDVMFQTVNEGVITFEQLSNNMGNTLPLANALGISFEELGAGYAVMTKNGVGASQTETQIAALMRSAINPTTELTAAVQAYGYESVESLIATEGLTGYLSLLTEASGGTSEELFKLTGTAEATNAALLLGGENADEYAASVERMKASSEGLGATQTALNKQMESTAFSLRLLKTNMQAAAIAIGVQLEPGIRAVAKAMTGLIKGFLNLPKPVQRIIAGVTAFAGVLALVAGAVILFGSQIAAIGALFLGLLGPVALVIAAAVALYAAWQTNFLGIQDITRNAMDAVMGFLEPVTGFLGDLKDAWDATAPSSAVMDQINAWGGVATKNLSLTERAFRAVDVASGGMATNMINGFRDVGGVIREAFGLFMDGEFAAGFERIGDIFQNSSFGQGIATLADWTLDVAVPTVTGWIVDAAGDVWGALKSAAGFVWDGLVDLGVWTLNTAAPAVIGWIRAAGTNVWNALKGAAGFTWDGIEDLGAWTLNTAAPTVIGWIRAAGTNVWNALKSAAGFAWDGIEDLGSWTLNTAAPTVAGWIRAAGTNVWNALKSAAGFAWDGIEELGAWTLNTAAPTVTGWIRAAGTNVWNALKSAAGFTWDAVEDMGAWTLNTATPAITGWIADTAGDAWEALKSAAGWTWDNRADLGNVTITIGAIIWQETADIFSGLALWAAGKIGISDWSQVGTAIGTKFNEAMGQAFTLGGDVGGGIGAGINVSARVAQWIASQLEGLNLNSVGQQIGTKLVDAIGLVFVGGVGFESLKGQFYLGISTALGDVSWESVGKSFFNLFKAVLSLPQDFFAGLITGIGEGVMGAVEDIPWSDIGGALEEGFAGAFEGIASAVGDAMVPVINEVIDGINGVIDKLNELPGVDIGNLDRMLSSAEQKVIDFDTALKSAVATAALLAAANVGQSLTDVFRKPGGGGGGEELQARGPNQQIASINTSGAIGQLNELDRTIVTVRERLATITKSAAITIATAGGVGSLKTLDAAIDGTQLKLAALGGGGGRAAGGAGAGAGAIKITADNADALGKIQAVKDAIAGLGGGGGGPAALKGAAQGGGGIVIAANNAAAMQAIGDVTAGLAGLAVMAAAVVITGNNAAAMQAIGDVTAGLFGLASMTSAVVITGDNAAAMQSIGDVSAGMAGINGMSSLVVLLGDNGAAMRSIGDVSKAMFGIDGMTSTIYVKGDNSGAMAAIRAVKAYAGTSLGTATFTVRTVTVGSPRRVGAGMGAGMLKGWDRATGTRSPSTEMMKRGHYLYQGLDMGWTGSASNLPIGFDVARPALGGISSGTGMTSGITGPIGSAGTGGKAPAPNVTVHVHVAGNVTAEDDLTRTILTAVDTGVAEGIRQRQRAMGAV